MLKVTVFRKGRPMDIVVSDMLNKLSEEHTLTCANEHKKEIITDIEESRERTKKTFGYHISDAIDVEKIPNGYGVGKIQTLNQKAPHWFWMNFGKAMSGRTTPPGTNENPRIKGHFSPDEGGIFTKGQPKFPIFPKKAIVAFNYIEHSLASMIGKIQRLLK